jgi:hypothetical protein
MLEVSHDLVADSDNLPRLHRSANDKAIFAHSKACSKAFKGSSIAEAKRSTTSDVQLYALPYLVTIIETRCLPCTIPQPSFILPLYVRPIRLTCLHRRHGQDDFADR